VGKLGEGKKKKLRLGGGRKRERRRISGGKREGKSPYDHQPVGKKGGKRAGGFLNIIPEKGKEALSKGTDPAFPSQGEKNGNSLPVVKGKGKKKKKIELKKGKRNQFIEQDLLCKMRQGVPRLSPERGGGGREKQI